MAEFDILPPMECIDNMQFRRVKMLYEGNHGMISVTRTNMVMRRRLNHRRSLPCRWFDSSIHGLWKKYGSVNLAECMTKRLKRINGVAVALVCAAMIYWE